MAAPQLAILVALVLVLPFCHTQVSDVGKAAAPAGDDVVDEHLLLLPPPDGDAVAADPGVKSAGPPVFLLEPTDAFAVRLRPARLTCRAANALTVYFRCSGGQSRREPSVFSEHVNPHSGVRVVEAVLEVTREDVDEFFGKDKLKCDCVAWSSQGEVRSQPAAIDVAYLRKQFEASPYPQSARLGASAELHCLPPEGLPPPRVYWLRNGAPMEPDANVIVSSEGHLLVGEARLQDTANYSCVAENVAGRRVSDPALLTVYVDGGWATWSAWSECSATRCGVKGVMRRSRTCSSPAPLNGGQACPGSAVSKQECVGPCPPDAATIDGRWSPWSSWTPCGSDCRHHRRRSCSNPPPTNGGRFCSGRDTSVANCTGGLCKLPPGGHIEAVSSQDSVQQTEEAAVHPPDIALYVGLAVAIVVFTLLATVAAYRWFNRHKGGRGALYSAAPGGGIIPDIDKRRLQPDLTQTVAAACYEYPYSEPPPPPEEEEHHYDEPLPPGGSTSSLSSSTSNGTIAALQAALDSEWTATGVVTSLGTRLELDEIGVALTIPQGAVGKGRRQKVLLSVLKDDRHRPRLSEGQTQLSPVVMCGPTGLSLAKPFILSFQHCASTVPSDSWRLAVWTSVTPPDLIPVWQESVVLGEETINTPVYAQLDPGRVHLACEVATRCVIIGTPLKSGARKLLRLAVFGPPVPPLVPMLDYSLRVYVLEDTRAALHAVEREEALLGARLLDLPRPLIFEDCGGPLLLNLDDVGAGWLSKPQAGHQEIPFQHVWQPSHGHLHCSFALERVASPHFLSLTITASQGITGPHVQLRVQPDLGAVPVVPGLTTLTVATSSGCSSMRSSPASSGHSPFRVPRTLCKQLAQTLDPPNARGNDWRMLAHQLGVDRYINYFATKASPTEHILDLWEARHREPAAIADLLNILRLMGRTDSAALLERELGAWI